MKKQLVKFFNEDYEIMLVIKTEIDAIDYDIDDFEEMVNEMYNLNEIDELQHEELIEKCDTFVAVKYTDKDGNTIEL